MCVYVISLVFVGHAAGTSWCLCISEFMLPSSCAEAQGLIKKPQVTTVLSCILFLVADLTAGLYRLVSTG